MPSGYNKVIVIGDACVDLHIKIDDLINVTKFKEMPYQMCLGGTCGGTSVALSKLGVDTAFLGTVGRDYGGKFILQELENYGIDSSMTIVKDDLNTLEVFCFIDEEGERHLWGFPRVDQAYAYLDRNMIDIDKIKSAKWVHSSGINMLSNGDLKYVLPDLFKIAYEAGVPTSFDLNTRVSDLSLLDKEGVEAIRKTIPYVRYLTGSAKDEFMSFYPCEDYRDTLRYFAKNDTAVIARLGEEGFYVIYDGKEKASPSYNVEVVNTTGAGDNFNAGFIKGILQGEDVYEAAMLANAISGYVISRKDRNYTISDSEIEEFINNTKLRNN